MAFLGSIKARLLGLCTFLIVAGLILRVFFALPFAQEQLRDLAAAYQLSIATYVARDIEHSVQERRALIGQLVATLPRALLPQPEKLAMWVEERQGLSPLFEDGLLVLEPEGGLLAQYPVRAGHDRLVSSDPAWFQTALRADGPVLSKPQRAPDRGEPILVVAAPVRDAAGRVVAVVAGVTDLHTASFLERLDDIPLGASGGFLLISPADRLVVGASDAAMVLGSTPASGADPLHDRAMTGYRGTGTTTNAKGAEELATTVTVPGTGWFVVARMPTAEAFHPIVAMRGFFVRGSVAMLAIMLAILLFLLPRILRPLTNAARSMRAMAEGRLALAPLPITRRDEVGDLLLGFNQLAQELHEREARLHQAMEALDQLAGTDALTGAWNRRQFDEVVEREIDRSNRYGHTMSLMLLDLDNFKNINDEHGHAAGDRVLKGVADFVRANLRKSDGLIRWGGEEFIILMPGTVLPNAAVLAERVRASLAAQRTDGRSVTVSIGVAEYVAPDTREQWLARADAAMYRAKHAGRNRVELDPATSAPSSAEPGTARLLQLVWSDQFRSGNPTLDAQHQGLFEDTNRILSVVLLEQSTDVVAAAVETLIADMIRHFQDEETELAEIGYPDIAVHAASHRALVRRAVELVGRYRGGGLDVGVLFQFLARDFVSRHLLSEDRAYFPYLNRPSS